MTAVRAVLIATIILVLAATPLVAPAFGGASSDESTAYAAFGGGVRTGDPALSPSQKDNKNQNNNNNNDNNNDNSNNNNSNSNNNNSNGNSNNNGNDNRHVIVVVRRPNESFNRPTKCFDTRELGTIQLGTGSFDVTVQVMPHSSFGQTTRLTLKRVPLTPVAGTPNPQTVAPGTLVDSVVFQLVAQSSCDGAEIGMLPNTVNLGIIYNVTTPIDKSKLQIVRWTGSAWTNVDTVPDPIPGNPYVSTSTNQAGIYALIQKP